MRERRAFLLLWTVVLAAGGIALATLGRYGFYVAAFGFLYATLATSWSWLRSTGLFSFGQAAFFGCGALTQAWLVTAGALAPGRALAVSALAGALAALPLVPALRLSPAGFALATLAYATLLTGLAGIAPAAASEGFLLPASSGFDGAAPPLVAVAAVLALAVSVGYQVFLGRPGGRAANALRQAPETALSLGIDSIGERCRPLVLGAAATSLAGALYAHLVGSVEASVVFSPTFSLLPMVLGMLGGALSPLGGILGTLALYPLDELILRPALLEAHTLAYGVVLIGLLLIKPEGLLKAPAMKIPAGRSPRRASHSPFSLAVYGLTVRRSRETVLQNVGFVVESEQILRVLGPNGAGKTSLLLAIAGRLPAARGQILFGGVPPPRGAAARARRGLARTFQAPRPFSDWTVRQNLAFAAECAGAAGDVDKLLEDLDLAALEGRPAGQLSVGEGKRLEFARALAFRPAVLLLDEPLAGLTPRAAERVSRLIERARHGGAAVVWVEHGPVSGQPVDQVLVLENGQTRFLGKLADWESGRGALSS
jgi:ABC-type multidrug transport system ATPase subunit/ABC-type branched-subunit amino acid transport system permease subunit